MIIRCVCCGKQAISGTKPSRSDPDVTTRVGARAAFHQDECWCGYCAEEMDENGLFPEEREAVNRKEKILNVIRDNVTDLLYYDREGCEDLPIGHIEKAVKKGEITVDEMVETFKQELIKGLK